MVTALGLAFGLVVSYFLGSVFIDTDTSKNTGTNMLLNLLGGIVIFFLLGAVIKILTVIFGLGMTAHGL